MRKIGIIVEARMGSTRLLGKVMKKINNEPILHFMHQRLRLIKNVDKIIIATTRSKKDNIINDFCKSFNMHCFRGSENDVMLRVIKCAEHYNLDDIVEITGDDPLVDPYLSSKVISKYIKYHKYNTICSNDFYNQLPLGFYTRVFSLRTLKKIYKKSNYFNKENVESYFYQNPSEFDFIHLHKYSQYSKYKDIRLTLDTSEDFKLIKKIITNFNYKYDFNLDEIVKFLNKNPRLKKINQNVKQNEIK